MSAKQSSCSRLPFLLLQLPLATGGSLLHQPAQFLHGGGEGGQDLRQEAGHGVAEAPPCRHDDRRVHVRWGLDGAGAVASAESRVVTGLEHVTVHSLISGVVAAERVHGQQVVEGLGLGFIP